MDKAEFLDFLRYLKAKNHIIVDPAIRGGMYDLTHRTKAIISAIKNLPIDEAYLAIGKVFVSAMGRNVNQNMFPLLYYFNDVVEYLISCGYKPSEAEFLTRCMSHTYFKKHYTRKPHLLSNDFYLFAKACKGLATYDMITAYLPTEYQLYKDTTLA